jgi:hypothetical protein
MRMENAEGGNRTLTSLHSLGPEPSASASSTTSAEKYNPSIPALISYESKIKNTLCYLTGKNMNHGIKKYVFLNHFHHWTILTEELFFI